MLCATCSNELFRRGDAAPGIAVDDRVTQVRFQPGDVLFEEGAPIKGIFCLHSGRVALVRRDDVGDTFVTAIVLPGDLLGVVGLMGDGVYHNGGMALEECEGCYIPREAFLELIRLDPGVLMSAMRRLCNRITMLHTRLDGVLSA